MNVWSAMNVILMQAVKTQMGASFVSARLVLQGMEQAAQVNMFSKENVTILSPLCCVCSPTPTDIDECEAGIVSCDTNAECNNTDGSYTCSCSSGFSGDGMRCVGE